MDAENTPSQSNQPHFLVDKQLRASAVNTWYTYSPFCSAKSDKKLQMVLKKWLEMSSLHMPGSQHGKPRCELVNGAPMWAAKHSPVGVQRALRTKRWAAPATSLGILALSAICLARVMYSFTRSCTWAAQIFVHAQTSCLTWCYKDYSETEYRCSVVRNTHAMLSAAHSSGAVVAD